MNHPFWSGGASWTKLEPFSKKIKVRIAWFEPIWGFHTPFHTCGGVEGSKNTCLAMTSAKNGILSDPRIRSVFPLTGLRFASGCARPEAVLSKNLPRRSRDPRVHPPTVIGQRRMSLRKRHRRVRDRRVCPTKTRETSTPVGTPSQSRGCLGLEASRDLSGLCIRATGHCADESIVASPMAREEVQRVNR